MKHEVENARIEFTADEKSYKWKAIIRFDWEGRTYATGWRFDPCAESALQVIGLLCVFAKRTVDRSAYLLEGNNG